LILDLLKNDADVKKTDFEGNTALHYVMHSFNWDLQKSHKIADLLLKYDIDPNTKNLEQMTPLHVAVKSQSVPAIRFIVEYNKYHQPGFDLNKKGGFNNNSPL
jgi:ankyrin repeat protein